MRLLPHLTWEGSYNQPRNEGVAKQVPAPGALGWLLRGPVQSPPSCVRWMYGYTG